MSQPLKTVRELIQVASGYFDERRIDSPRLDAELLLGAVLSLSRIELYLQHDRPVTSVELERYRELVRRRGSGTPLQLLIGSWQFYSRSFKLEPGVFVPRQETEVLVERSVELLLPQESRLIAPRAADIGCGSGVVGISLAAEIPTLQVVATDINPAAVRLSAYNARRLGVASRMTFLQGDLFDPLPAHLRGDLDLVVSNPPYVRRDEIATLQREVAEYDPVEALDGGADGLAFYRTLAQGLGRWLCPGGAVALEIGWDQGEAVTEILQGSGCRDIRVHPDYARKPRVIVARHPGRTPESADPSGAMRGKTTWPVVDGPIEGE